MIDCTNKHTLQESIDSPENEDILQGLYCSHNEIETTRELQLAPYWALKGTIDYNLNGHGRKDYQNADGDDIMVKHISGYWCGLQPNQLVYIDGKVYRFVITLSLPEELELQADDGEFVYFYAGPNFLEVYVPANLEHITGPELEVLLYDLLGRTQTYLYGSDTRKHLEKCADYKSLEAIRMTLAGKIDTFKKEVDLLQTAHDMVNTLIAQENEE